MKSKLWVVALILLWIMIMRHHRLSKLSSHPATKQHAAPASIQEPKEDFDFPFPGSCMHISV